MSNKLTIKDSPFAKAKKNIKVFGENLNILHSTCLVMESAKCIDKMEDAEKRALDLMLTETIMSLSDFIESRGDKWN